MNAQLTHSATPLQRADVSVRRKPVPRCGAGARAAGYFVTATALAATPFGTAQRAVAAEPEVRLTALDSDVRISRHGSYVINWSSTDIPPNTALSLQLAWTAADSGVRIGGVVQAGREARLITTLLDATAMRAFMANFKSTAIYSTIETGRYVWDVAKFCSQNTDNGHSVCDSAPAFHLQLILRASNDPCGDNVRCDKPRTLFKTYASRGAISFAE